MRIKYDCEILTIKRKTPAQMKKLNRIERS